jgi:hypothetical protein
MPEQQKRARPSPGDWKKTYKILRPSRIAKAVMRVLAPG